MLGIIVELIISWLLLKLIAKQNLSVLGFAPTWPRVAELFAGLLWPILYFGVFEYIVSLLVKNPYRINPDYYLNKFWMENIYLFKSVAFEDLIFRGALLYILIKKIGSQKAVLCSAIAFGVYHWFSWNAFGNPVQMLIVFTTTGMAGYVFALAYEKTRSLYLPFALHFGCDFATMIIFSQDKGMGKQLLLKTFEKDPVSPGTFVSVIVIAIYFIGFGLFTWLLLTKVLDKFIKKTPSSI